MSDYDFLLNTMEYEEYPYPETAKMTDEAHVTPSKCVACNPSADYVVIALCPHHYPDWLENRKRFEKRFYNGKELR
jgi:hypothetical protein